MGDLVRFPQERCRESTEAIGRSATILVLPPGQPVPHPLLDPMTYLLVGKSFEDLWEALNWPG